MGSTPLFELFIVIRAMFIVNLLYHRPKSLQKFPEIMLFVAMRAMSTVFLLYQGKIRDQGHCQHIQGL